MEVLKRNNCGEVLTKRLTLKQCHKFHRELWNWLSLNPGEQKNDWPEWNRFNYFPLAECFACQNSRNNDYGCAFCEPNCMYVWQDNKYCTLAEFGEWDNLMDDLQDAIYDGEYEVVSMIHQVLIKLARKIRDLPLKEDI